MTRPLLVALALGVAAACSSPPRAASSYGGSARAATESRSAALGDTIHVMLGESAAADDGRLVVAFITRGPDSRCPANAVCVWMGDAAVRIAARTGGTTVERELHTGVHPRSLTVGHYVVEVVGLLPYPGSGASGTPTVLLRVTRT